MLERRNGDVASGIEGRIESHEVHNEERSNGDVGSDSREGRIKLHSVREEHCSNRDAANGRGTDTLGSEFPIEIWQFALAVLLETARIQLACHQRRMCCSRMLNHCVHACALGCGLMEMNEYADEGQLRVPRLLT